MLSSIQALKSIHKMKLLRPICVFLLLIFSWPTWGDDIKLYQKIRFNEREVPFYTFSELTPQVSLQMDYAKFEIQNPDEWLQLRDSHEAYEIDLVFTKYPKRIENWRTNYYELLNDRLKALFAIDSALSDPKIHWNMVLQTQCVTESDAKRYFHGFVVKYRPKQVKMVEEITRPEEIDDLISGKLSTPDSTVLKVMQRHPEWNDMLAVVDWTGSMYQFGAQLVLWHKMQSALEPSRIKYFVLFNDGNTKKTWQKKPGKTGGVYRARTNELQEVVTTMHYVMKKGNGGDIPENDLEAILTGTQYLEGYQDVLLIADNRSAVRDMDLLTQIDKPIRIILCGVVNGKIHPDYLRIARETGGSIHTLDQDITRFAQPGAR